MASDKLKINQESIRTELKAYKSQPYECLFEYIWNSFDAGATLVHLDFAMPPNGIGTASNVSITDNGTGWDFDDDATTNNFMSSTKRPRKDITLPKGQYGRGRYSFIWIAEMLYGFSKGKRIILKHNTEIEKADDATFTQDGTKIVFDGISESFSDILLSQELHQRLILEFGWFLFESDKYKIIVNSEAIDPNDQVKELRKYTLTSLPDKIQKELNGNFEAEIVLWKEKTAEYSKFYFLNDDNIELFKQNTGLNKKSDDFWHSVYIKSSLFGLQDRTEDEGDSSQKVLSFNKNQDKRIKSQVITFLKNELVRLRKPYLATQSTSLLEELKDENLIPVLTDFGIYDEDSYGDLIKTIYTISPSLFVGKSKPEKKFICATFAGLLSTQDDILIKTLLEQLQELSEDEKEDLLSVLKRTTLSGIIKTIKEIDHRLEVIDKLKFLITEHERETLEVKHLQKILDENFWLFGEQFRLFSSTEGALRNVLIRYAKDILKIEDPELKNSPNGEVDLFLTKSESIGEAKQVNIIVEIKRASKNLGKEQYDQIEGYMESIRKESICNGGNQYWEFYLIGKDYDSHIDDKIDSAKNHGQKDKGLCYNIKDGQFKIYVRKWSDLLEVEWGTKMKYLKEKLQIQAKKPNATPDKIMEELKK